MKTIKIKNYNKTISIPTCLEECTVEFFIKMSKLTAKEGVTEVEIISGLSSLSVNTLFSLEHSNLDDEIISSLAWWKDTEELLTMKPPKTIKVDSVVLAVPSNLNAETLGQKLTVKQLLLDASGQPEKFFDAIPEAFAVYFAPLMGYSQKGMVETVMKMKIIDVYPVVNFFLSRYKTFAKGGIRY